MYIEMQILQYNIKNCYMKHSQNWGVHRFQIDGQAFTSSYVNTYRSDFNFQSSFGILVTNLFHPFNEYKGKKIKG